MLERQAVRRQRIERGQAGVGERGGKLRIGAGRGAAGARAVDQRNGVGVQVVRRSAGALVRVGDGAAALERPLAGGDRPIDAARAGRCGGDQARLGHIEAVGNLHQHGHVLLAAAIVGEGQVLAPGDLALPRRDVALRVHIGAVQRAVATACRGIHQRAVVGVDGVPAQLGRRGRGRVQRQRLGGGAQAVLAEAGGEQVVGVAVVVPDRDRADVRRLGIGIGVAAAGVVVARAARRQQQACRPCQRQARAV